MTTDMYLYIAIALILIIISSKAWKKYYQLKHSNEKKVSPIIRNSGDKKLYLVNAGSNKVTVLATLRQITDIDLVTAKTMIESAPAVIMENVSEKEADLTKQALEFVGATIEIK